MQISITNGLFTKRSMEIALNYKHKIGCIVAIIAFVQLVLAADKNDSKEIKLYINKPKDVLESFYTCEQSHVIKFEVGNKTTITRENKKRQDRCIDTFSVSEGNEVKFDRFYSKAIIKTEGKENPLINQGETISVTLTSATCIASQLNANGKLADDALKILSLEIQSRINDEFYIGMMPDKKLLIGESWKVDCSNQIDTIQDDKSIIVDRKLSVGNCKLSRAFSRYGKPRLELLAEFDFVLKSMKIDDIYIEFSPKSKISIVTEWDICADGRHPEKNLKSDIKVNYSLKIGETVLTVDNHLLVSNFIRRHDKSIKREDK